MSLTVILVIMVWALAIVFRAAKSDRYVRRIKWNLFDWVYSRSAFPSIEIDSFSTAETAGEIGEKRVQDILDASGDLVLRYVTTSNMKYLDKNFEIDYLVFLQGFGMLLLEVKYYSGSVYISAEPEWTQQKQQHTNVHKNASTQVLRTKRILKQLLSANNLDKYPIMPVVVFAHETARIYTQLGKTGVQTEVILADDLVNWISQIDRSPNIVLSQDYVESVMNILKEYESEYTEGDANIIFSDQKTDNINVNVQNPF